MNMTDKYEVVLRVAAVHTGLCWLGVAAAQLTCPIKSIFGGEIETSQLDNQIDKLNLFLCMYNKLDNPFIINSILSSLFRDL